MPDRASQQLADEYANKVRMVSDYWLTIPEIRAVIDWSAGYGMDAAEGSPVVIVRCPAGPEGRQGHRIINVRLSAYHNNGTHLRVVPAAERGRPERDHAATAHRANRVDPTYGGPSSGGYWSICQSAECDGTVIPSSATTCARHGALPADEIDGRTRLRCPAARCAATPVILPDRLLHLYCCAVQRGEQSLRLAR